MATQSTTVEVTSSDRIGWCLLEDTFSEFGYIEDISEKERNTTYRYLIRFEDPRDAADAIRYLGNKIEEIFVRISLC